MLAERLEKLKRHAESLERLQAVFSKRIAELEAQIKSARGD
jgi:chaperonin cofactor prefoldin